MKKIEKARLKSFPTRKRVFLSSSKLISEDQTMYGYFLQSCFLFFSMLSYAHTTIQYIGDTIFMRFLLILSAFLTLTACLPDNNKEKIKEIQLGDVLLNVPQKYLYRYNEIDDNPDFRVAVMYPEMEALEKSHQAYWDEGRKFEDIRFLIAEKNKYKTLNEMVSILKENYSANNFRGSVFELEKWTAEPPEARDSEIYIQKENNKIIGFLRCVRDGAKNNPQCGGEFQKFGLSIDFSFDKDNLKNWPDIRDRGFALIEGFIVTKEQGEKDNAHINSNAN